MQFMLPLKSFPGGIKAGEVRMICSSLITIGLLEFKTIQFFQLPNRSEIKYYE